MITTDFIGLTRFAAITAFVICSATVQAATRSKPAILASPDGHIAVEFSINADGAPHYAVALDGRPVLQESRLGLVRDDADFTKGLRVESKSSSDNVRDNYEILTAKRRENSYVANQQIFHLTTADGKKMDITFRVSNDGVAFRYFFPETNATVHKLSEEVTSFHFLPETRAWLQPMQAAKTGFGKSNPAYEEFYQKDIPAGTPSPMVGWVYPALFRSGDTWLLVSETALDRYYCGTRLRKESPDREYSVGFPDPRETINNGPVNPESKLPWITPWRIIVVGSLKTIAESMLGVDLAYKPRVWDVPIVYEHGPGKASWSWPLLGDSSVNFDTQKEFIDYAADMGWRYCLIDALWDKQIGYPKIRQLADYARKKNVSILLWYNSAGDWNTTPQTPRDKMLTHKSRIEEFELLTAIGIAGMKIDFFGGDGQSVINYYHDILEDSEPYAFLVNFHGATLPRGFQRAYPNLMTMEAIKGEEFVTFEQRNADEEPAHATMLPFTRNVFDPMDFTPMALDRINNRIQRRTTSAFELALSVLFTSGIQHYAEIPAGMAKVPDYVRDFLRHVPSVWDDVKFIDGFPGKYVVMARKGDGHWYVTGVNGEDSEKKLTLDLKELGVRDGTLITDGDDGNLSFREQSARLGADKKLEVTLKPRGGFVLVFK